MTDQDIVSRSRSHAELSALLLAVTEALGVYDGRSGVEDRPYLRLIYDRLGSIETTTHDSLAAFANLLVLALGGIQHALDPVNASLLQINTTLTGMAGIDHDISADLHRIREIMEANRADAVAVTAHAQEVLAAHEESARHYLEFRDQPPPIDPFPFTVLPAGTKVKELPSGGRLFTMPDSTFIRSEPGGALMAVDPDGQSTSLAPARAGVVMLPGGLELTLQPTQRTVTHETAGIEGLPLDVEPVLVADGRYSVEVCGGVRLDVLHDSRQALIINPTGTIIVLGARIQGVGEEVTTQILAGGAVAWTATESRHRGIVQGDGTINVAFACGRDLIIHFPEDDGELPGPSEPICFNCQERG